MDAYIDGLIMGERITPIEASIEFEEEHKFTETLGFQTRFLFPGRFEGSRPRALVDIELTQGLKCSTSYLSYQN